MRALLIVDLQNDFLPGGALGVPGGDEIISVVNRMQAGYPLVVATQDWHPRDHGSFASRHEGVKPGDLGQLAGLPQVFWPDHCVQGTTGAAFAADFEMSRVEAIIRKGTDPTIDSYSAFFDNGHRKATGLAEYLRGRGVEDLHVVGLATDYCVRFSALDARAQGFTTVVVAAGCRAVELSPGDADRAYEAMRAGGVQVVHKPPL